MKTLYLIRHAKSSWDNPKLNDFDRPLNERGKNDAPVMGKWLKKNNEIPDYVISSPANRAKKTAQKICREVNYDEKKIYWEQKLYETTVPVWLKIVCGFSKKYHHVYLVGHNDTITQFCNYLSGAAIPNIPTCGIVKIKFNTVDWREISAQSGDLQWFQFPKNLADKI
jgi:phosphohistidine phosphatase